MRTVPYTTKSGLQIGCQYTSPKRVDYFSNDALMLQTALLSRRGRSWPIVNRIVRMLLQWL